MNGNIEFTSTNEARTHAESLEQGGNYCKSLVADLESIKSQIIANWEGDTNDYNEVIASIDSVIETYQTKIIPSLLQLSVGVTSFANAIDTVGSSNVEGGSNATPGVEGSSEAESAAGAGTGKPDFWAYHGQDFASDWDYSGCDSGLDYIGATVGGLCGTVGSVVNFAVDGVSEVLGWLFG